MTKIKYEVPSRIAINLYDMNGELGRVDGGMGFSLNFPRLEFIAEKSDKIELENTQNIGKELADSVKDALTLMQEKYSFYGIKISFLKGIPVHSGFGSKTATLISTGHSFGNLYDNEIDPRDLGVLFNRGGTSGLGINLIDKGGFILEGGHCTKIKQGFKPSSAMKNMYPAPVLAHYDMPDWNILICLPISNKTYGQKEISFFDRVCPVPSNDVAKIARVTLSQCLPGILENDIEQFSYGINAIQKSHWKSNEILNHGNLTQSIINYILEQGAIGAGMSSLGPGIYAFGNNMEEIADKLYSRKNIKYSFIKVTKANNKGMRINKIK
jgi:beta-ribofuranosylaminobenzene 5'-phosphate synthase